MYVAHLGRRGKPLLPPADGEGGACPADGGGYSARMTDQPAPLPSPATPAAAPKPTGAKTAAMLRAKLARAEARAAALKGKLADREAFAKWHGKSSARALARALLLRRAAPPAVLSTLGLAPLSPAESAKLDELLAAFSASPWDI